MDMLHLKISAIATLAAFLVVGISLESPRQATAGDGARPDSTCTSPNPCLSKTNTSTGTAITGVSKMGSGIIGETKFNSTSQSNGQVGVLGEDLSTSGGFNFGILGLSTNGAGVDGVSNAGIGVQGYSATLDAVRGNGARFGVYGLSTDGTGVRAESASATKQSLFIWQDGTGALIRAAQLTCNCYVMSLDVNGNLIARGSITQNGVPTFVTQTTTGEKVLSYGSRQSQPTIEDTGEAQLVDGSSYVRIDPKFAAAIDRAVVYTVLVTPEGDTNGVYVTSKSPQGFVVRENRGGRATVGFGYRIVAKPFDSNATRLPLLSTIPRLKAFDVPADGNNPHVRGLPRNGMR